MNEYLKQAMIFLEKANAKCNIEFGGISRNENWKEKEKRNWYDVTIVTPKGEMKFVFWDSIHNTEMSMITLKEYTEKKLKKLSSNMSYSEMTRAKRQLEKLKENAKPNEYDVLSCLQKYDVGTFEDFCSEFGYNEDSRTAKRIYFAVQRDYKNLLRIFNEDQMEELREIQ